MLMKVIYHAFPGTAEASLSRIVRRRRSNTGGYVLNPPSQIKDCAASPMRDVTGLNEKLYVKKRFFFYPSNNSRSEANAYIIIARSYCVLCLLIRFLTNIIPMCLKKHMTQDPGTAEASLSRIVRRRSSNTGGYVLNPLFPGTAEAGLRVKSSFSIQ